MTPSTSGLKVAYVVKMFPRLSETFILNEILELERSGVDVTVFSIRKPNEGRFHPQVSQLKAQVHYLDELDPKKWPVWLGRRWSTLAAHRQGLFSLVEEGLTRADVNHTDRVWASAWIAAQCLEDGIQHLHAHFASLPSTLAYWASRISGLSYSFTAHAKDIYVYDADEHLLREKLRSADAVITVTEFNRRHLVDLVPDIDHEHIQVVYNGINLEQFRPHSGRERDPATILAVGRLVPKKGFHLLLEAIARLETSGTNCRCLIVGDGTEAADLERRCHELKLQQVVSFEGAVHQDQVRELMHRATVLCLPCIQAPDNNQDALPTVLLEALGSGLPAVSTHLSGIPEIIDSGLDGELVPPNDADALSQALARVLASDQLRRNYAQAGRVKAEERFDITVNVGKVRAVFEDCVRGRSARSEAKPLTLETRDASVA